MVVLYSNVFTSWYTPTEWFLGKVLIGQGAIEGGHFVLLGLGFFSSLIVLYSLLRIFLSSFSAKPLLA